MSAGHREGRGYRQHRRWLYMSLVWPLLTLGVYAGCIYEQGNFHTVVSQEIYRSGQLDKAELGYYIQNYQIKSILNLRGVNAGSTWYQDEIHVAQRFGINHYDIEMSAQREVSDDDLRTIMSILLDAPKPILIHCKSGADRTGLVAALYQYSWNGQSPEDALKQLSILYGHFPFFGNATAAMDRTFWRYVKTHPDRRPSKAFEEKS